MNRLPEEIEKMAALRSVLKAEKKYKQADNLRKKIEEKGYIVTDTPDSQNITPKVIESKINPLVKNSLIAVFGSGEMSPAGRSVHEFLIKDIAPPVKIALLETPTGFEENPHHWYIKLAEMMQIGLQNYKPEITRVEALRKDGQNSTNDPEILKPLLESDYLHTGAGSPSYAAGHLKNSLAHEYLRSLAIKGIRMSFASASAVAFSKYLLPVYEIYKVGEDLNWKEGLNFFANWGLNITFIPHWNNTEGGKDIDTTRCYMGEKRFQKLLEILPGPTTILGIDEQTACIFDLEKKEVKLIGHGRATILTDKKIRTVKPNSKFSFSLLK